MLAAAQANLDAGAFDPALAFLAAAESEALDEIGQARLDLLYAEVAFAQNRDRDAPLLLLRAARRLEPIDVRLSRNTYLDAWSAALFAGNMAPDGGDLADVSLAARSAPKPMGQPLPSDLLLDGLAEAFTDGVTAATPSLQRAVAAFMSDDVSVEEMLRWGWLATRAANLVWDYDRCLEIGMRAAQLARESGALEVLAVIDNAACQAAALGGDFDAAAVLAAEVEAVKEATGTRIPSHGALALGGIRGQETEASEMIQSVITEATAAGQGTAVQYANWAKSVLMNGLGRYRDALDASVDATDGTTPIHVATWALIELIEAAMRTGNNDQAAEALTRLEGVGEGSDSDWSLGIRARSRALVSDGQVAENLYREAIGHLERTALRPDLARAHLLFGEWMRRAGRRIDAREQLRKAYEMFTDIGMEAFAERAQAELLATGETVRKRNVETLTDLTPQELQVARLASDGLTNPEIGARLFLSPRTIEWHLRKVFVKLGITSRRELRAALPNSSRKAVSA
jgi:DNA-binding CsgD family transcriptional regulator